MTALFIGVVSHAGTRFADSHGPEGFGARLAAALGPLGIATTVQLSLEDRHNPQAMPIDGPLIRASLDAQLRTEHAWQAYLAADRQVPVLERAGAAGVLALRWARQTLAHVRPWHGADRDDTSGARIIRRLVNIELAHLALMRAGIHDGADWLLVAEDDANADDIDDCAAGIAGIMTDTEGQSQPAYVNVSQSFSADELGITHLLTPVGSPTWRGSEPRALLSARRPVTNTVCAMLYRTAFARTLLAALDAIPIEPVLPIDWKLNAALMQLFRDGVLSAGDCWLVDPAPIDQRSMRNAA